MDERIYSWFNEEEDDSGVAGFMCKTDFECELGAALGGNVIYASIEDCLAERKCAKGCGVVEVRVRGVRIALPPCEDDA